MRACACNAEHLLPVSRDLAVTITTWLPLPLQDERKRRLAVDISSALTPMASHSEEGHGLRQPGHIDVCICGTAHDADLLAIWARAGVMLARDCGLCSCWQILRSALHLSSTCPFFKSWTVHRRQRHRLFVLSPLRALGEVQAT